MSMEPILVPVNTLPDIYVLCWLAEQGALDYLAGFPILIHNN